MTKSIKSNCTNCAQVIHALFSNTSVLVFSSPDSSDPGTAITLSHFSELIPVLLLPVAIIPQGNSINSTNEPLLNLVFSSISRLVKAPSGAGIYSRGI